MNTLLLKKGVQILVKLQTNPIKSYLSPDYIYYYGESAEVKQLSGKINLWGETWLEATYRDMNP